MNRRFALIALSVLLVLPLSFVESGEKAPGLKASDYAGRVGSLIDPQKLKTLGKRGANPRIQKCVFWLGAAKSDNQKPELVLNLALAGKMSGEASKLTTEALLRNLAIADRLGCLDADGLGEMKRGKAPTVQRGPYKGDQLSVDHIIPRANGVR